MVWTPPSLNRHQSAIVEMRISTKTERTAPMIKISVIGLDLAKNVFQVHGIDTEGEVIVRKQLKRSQLR